MSSTSSIWEPVYAIAPKTARRLMEIEKARVEVEHTPLPLTAQAELRRQARVRSTHYSTRIEGNRLTLAEAEKVVRGTRTAFHGRERDVREVRNYWNALIRVEEGAEAKRPVTEEAVRRLHALVERGPRARPSPWRDGQNVVRDSGSGAIVYLPPEARDVPGLMAALVRWIREAENSGVPVPLIAGLAHYQFVTIHPYYDGNGRTARLLATWLLHRGGYGLHGFLSVEEYHARDLAGYYRALAVHPHHNYYEGRADAELTSWVEYFVATLAETFEAVRREARRLAVGTVPPSGTVPSCRSTAAAPPAGVPAEPEPLRKLDRRARIALALFARTERIASADVARALGLSERMARVLLAQWVKAGWLVVADPSRRKRAYALTAIYRQYIGNLSAMPRRTTGKD